MHRINRSYLIYIRPAIKGAFSLFLGLYLFPACQSNLDTSPENSRTPAIEVEDIFPDSIATLAQNYCGTCHALPAPNLLDKKTWKNYVLPRMGYFLGRYSPEMPRDSLMETAGTASVFPPSPLIGDSLWQLLEQFYLSEAPEQLSIDHSYSTLPTTAPFKAKFPNYFLSPPSATLVQFGQKGQIYVGDANSKSLYVFDRHLELQNSARVREGAVHLAQDSGNIKLTVMGSFSPTDIAEGFILGLPKNGQSAPYLILDELQRPVHTEYVDLDGDGLTDIVTCEYGKWTGSLSWWKNTGSGNYERQVLRAKPGAIKSMSKDFDGDGLVDILALFAQGDEGIFLYQNLGNGQFEEKNVLTFPSTYGSSYFDLIDWNKDGEVDIIYTAGDNADYPPVKKPYHGIYIFQNTGGMKFTEVLFHPLPGAYKAICRDFDEDGDLDIAAISFFPDFEEEASSSFLYLENQAGQFKPSSIPQSQLGRWISMDVGDLDQDGDLDLVLGSLAFEIVPPNPLLQQWIKQGIPFIVLENTLRSGL